MAEFAGWKIPRLGLNALGLAMDYPDQPWLVLLSSSSLVM